MSADEVRAVVRVTLAVLARVGERTRTPADDLLIGVLRANEDRLAEAVAELLKEPTQPPPGERVAAALAAVGIRA